MKRYFVLGKYALMVLMIVTLVLQVVSDYTSEHHVFAAGTGVTYYVDLAGSDSHDGLSLSTPFKTINKAAQTAVAGDTVLIRGGTYRETVVPLNSGTAGNVITYQPYNGESVTVSGTENVTGWQIHNGSIYKTGISLDFGTDNQIFIDGSMGQLARWPNTGEDLMQPDFAVIDSAT